MLVIFLHLFKRNVIMECNKNQRLYPSIRITSTIVIKPFFMKLLVIGYNPSMYKQDLLGSTI